MSLDKPSRLQGEDLIAAQVINPGKYNGIPGVCSEVFLDIWSAERSLSVGVQVGAQTPFGFANPGKYHEMHGSVRGFSRISHRVCLQVEDSVAAQVYKPRKV